MLRQFEKQDEPFLHVYREHLSAILAIIQESGEELEGNVFFGHGYANPDANKLDATLRKKRNGLALFALSKSQILEVGFNSGFSALLMLTANPNLELVCVDIGYHSYVQPCARYLKTVFGDRFSLLVGDSREVLPLYLGNNNSFDGYHIDGDHKESVAETDLCNIINTGRIGSVICFDDADFPQLRNMITIHLLQGTVSHIFDPKFHLTSDNQMFLRLDKQGKL